MHYIGNIFSHATCFSVAFGKTDSSFAHFHAAENRRGRRGKKSITQKSHVEYSMKLQKQTYLENVPLKDLSGIPVVLDYLIPQL